MSDKMERWDFTDNENGCDAMVLSEDGEFVEYEVAIRLIRELERQLAEQWIQRQKLFDEAMIARKQLADRDAAWKRAIRNEFLTSYDSTSGELISSVIERLEAEGGGA